MRKRIITISREFGSGGRYIGEKLAQQLGVAYYDKEIIARVAEETGFSKEFVEKKGEYSPQKSLFAYAFVGRDSQGMSIEDHLYAAQAKIILDLVKKGPCVIVGRSADYILRDRTDCLHVFIHSSPEKKAERIRTLYGKTEEESIKLMKETDKKRSINYNYYTDQKWGAVRNYDVTLNSGTIGIDKCVEILVEMAKG